MEMFGNDLSSRTPLWSHLQQWESGGATAGGQAWDPDAEGEAEHGQSLTMNTVTVYNTCFVDDFRFFFFCRCPCGCNSRSRKLKMVTTLGWPCRLVPAERVWFWRVFDRLCQFYVFLRRSGKSVWTPDQHAHQDRSVPNPDFKVRVFVWVNASPSCFCSRNTETWITSSLSSSPLVFVRYYNERGDAVAKAAKQPHVVSLLFSRSQF